MAPSTSPELLVILSRHPSTRKYPSRLVMGQVAQLPLTSLQAQALQLTAPSNLLIAALMITPRLHPRAKGCSRHTQFSNLVLNDLLIGVLLDFLF